MATLLRVVISIALILAILPQNDGLKTKARHCPEEYGTCNKCMIHHGKLVALTRKMCGDKKEYTQAKCIRIYHGRNFVCEDGCNHCHCGSKGIASTKKACGKYVKSECLRKHPGGQWKCGVHICHCTHNGIGFSHNW